MSRILRSLATMVLSGRLPSRRALAALAKLHGMRLERRWPFLRAASGEALNLALDDLLEFQLARSPHPRVLVVGAFDGMTNDPVSDLVIHHARAAVLVEPQPGPFERLRGNLSGLGHVHLVNAAVDRVGGSRTMYYVPHGIEGLPEWVAQLASFSREHLLAHEHRAPGLVRHIRAAEVRTLSFEELLDQHAIGGLDVLQIDAEGFDAQLLQWFPFERVKPALLYYETEHMNPEDLRETRARLRKLGYVIHPSESLMDDMAVLL